MLQFEWCGEIMYIQYSDICQTKAQGLDGFDKCILCRSAKIGRLAIFDEI